MFRSTIKVDADEVMPANYKTIERRGIADEETEIVMALTRIMLKALGIEAEKIEEIINAHTETVDALKAERDGYKADAEKLPQIQKKLDDAEALNAGNWKTKYEKEHSDFDAYKADIAGKAAKEAKTAAYRALLLKAGVSEKRLDSVLKVTDLSKVEMDGENIKGADDLEKNIKTEWADFISTEGMQGAGSATPPANQGNINYDALSDADFYKATYEASKAKK